MSTKTKNYNKNERKAIWNILRKKIANIAYIYTNFSFSPQPVACQIYIQHLVVNQKTRKVNSNKLLQLQQRIIAQR